MNQSTIYRQHERRRARTYALKDDQRPAIIRVASGLPLLNLVFPPYQPEKQSISESAVADFSNSETVCTIHPVSSLNSSSQSSASAVPKIVLASAVGGGLAKWVVGRRYGTPQCSVAGAVQSPFQGVPTLHGPGILAFTRHSEPTKVLLAKTQVQGGIAPIAIGASVAALLFGTKALAMNAFGEKNASEPIGSFLSSAASGAVVGMVYAPVQAVESLKHRLTLGDGAGASQLYTWKQGVSSLIRTRGSMSLVIRTVPVVVSQHVLGATLFFSTYDMMKSSLSSSSSTNGNTGNPSQLFAIGISGAMAGAVYHGVTSGGILPVMLRAMPQYAILFLGYETILNVATTPISK